MNEKQTLSPDFDEQIKAKITELQGYYMINGADHTFDRNLAELEKHILSEPIETKRNALLADLWSNIYVGASRPDKARVIELAEAGNNGDAYACLRLNDVLGTDDYAVMLETIDEIIAKLRGMSGTTGIGIYLFWRGRAKIGLGRPGEALADFREAYSLIPPDNVYNALCACALKTYDFLAENSDDPCRGFLAVADQYYFDGERLAYVSEPGFGDNIAWRNNYYGMFTYVISRFDNVFFDTTMSVGETRTSRDEKSTLTLVSYDETVTTPAGDFADCMHISMNIKGEYTADAWYAKDIGLVRTVIVSTSFSEEYILADYTHVGGSGYYPFAVGNRWRYEKPDMPDALFYLFENEITWTNGTTANISTSHPVGYKKGEQENDSYLLLDRASDLAYEWKVDEAIEVLGRAVVANTSQNAAIASLGALEHLERVREWMNKGYRICPGGYNASCLTASDGKINYDETAFAYVSAYRWGSRGEENRIFGVKPFRYLERLMGAVWDNRWVPGYVEDRVYDIESGIDLHAALDDGHTVTTAAGTFENCLRLTLFAEKKGETEPYYFRDYAYTHCGKKQFYFARGVGIVRFDCTWGDCLSSRAELTSYENPTHSDAYLPLTLGCAWTYDEMNLTEEGYRARRWVKVAAGMTGRYLIHDAQEFVYLGTEDEYEAFKASLAAKG